MKRLLLVPIAIASVIPVGASDLPTHEIRVTLDPSTRSLSAEATLSIAPTSLKSVVLTLSPTYRLTDVAFSGKPLKFTEETAKDGEHRYTIRLPKHPTEAPLALHTRWSGTPPALPNDYKFNRNEVTDLPNGYLSPDGAFLPGVPGTPPSPTRRCRATS
ncbi:MAG: hypothetical protein U0V87_08085 [Acidobacteriota bacterium]